MSAELFSNTPEAIEPAAVSSFNEARSYYASLPKYLTKIAQWYEQAPNGKAELLQVKRIAQFLAHNQPGTFHADTEAIYNGQLIGLQVLNLENPAQAPIGNMANTFMKVLLSVSESQVEQDLRTSIKAGLGAEHESVESQRERLYEAAEDAKVSLSVPDVTYKKTHSFEPFIDTLTSELYGDNYELSELAKIGFRLTLQQHEQSSFSGFTKGIAKEVNESDDFDEAEYSEPSHLDLLDVDNEIAIIEKAETQLVITALEKITRIRNREMEIEEYFPIINADTIAKTFLKKFEKLQKSLPMLPLGASEEEEDDYREYLDDELDSFNIENNLIQQGDFLFISGDFIGIVAVQSEDEYEGEPVSVHNEDYAKFRPHTEIRGEFSGVYVNNTPPLSELEKAMKQDRAKAQIDTLRTDGAPYEATSEVLSPVIQIINPTFVNYKDANSEPVIEYGMGMTIEIPLIYNRHVFYQILRADDPKSDSML